MTAQAREAVTLWLLCRGGEFGATQPPFSGGPAEQPACLMESFAVIESAVAALRPKR